MALSGFYQTFVFGPVVDGKFIVENPVVTLDRRTVNGVSFIFLSIISDRSRMCSCIGRSFVNLEYFRRQYIYSSFRDKRHQFYPPGVSFP